MDEKEGWELHWSGCTCKEEDWGACFNLENYDRACAKCGKELKGTWYCTDCGFQPDKIKVKTSREKEHEIELCPECGRLFL